jgi:hypothetical protein
MSFILDQTYTTGQDNADGSGIGNLRRAANNNTIIGMSFTPTISAPVTRISFLLKKIGAPTGNIWMTIGNDGADPTASLRGSQSSNVDVSTLSGSYTQVNFTFPTPVFVTGGVKVWALLNGDYTVSSSNAAVVGINTTTAGYSGGSFGRYGNGGAAWEVTANYDVLFNEYHDMVAVLFGAL